MRGLGELAVVSGLPEIVVDLFALATRLGNPWILLGVLALLYAVSDHLPLDRRRIGFVLAAAFVALGVTLAAKSAFALPRPPGAAASGYGFPSGHALGATVVWGTAAVVFDVGSRRRRLLVAGAVVPLVAASRVVIGVHYLVDVVAGTVVGVVVVGAVFAVGPRREVSRDFSYAAVDRTFALAAATGVAALVVTVVAATAVTSDTLLTAGATVGGWFGWRIAEPTVAVDRLDAPLSPRGTAVAVAGLPVVLGGLLAVDYAAEAAAIPDLLVMGVAGGCIVLLFALPRMAARLVHVG